MMPSAIRTGYLLHDDRVSGGKKVESEIVTCSHCQKVVMKHFWQVQGGWCSACSKHICYECAQGREKRREPCKTFLQIVDEHVEKQARERNFKEV